MLDRRADVEATVDQATAARPHLPQLDRRRQLLVEAEQVALRVGAGADEAGNRTLCVALGADAHAAGQAARLALRDVQRQVDLVSGMDNMLGGTVVHNDHSDIRTLSRRIRLEPGCLGNEPLVNLQDQAPEQTSQPLH